MPVLKAERPLFNIVQAVLVLLLKGHGAGVTVEKSMRTDFFIFIFVYFLFIFFFFLRFDSRFFPRFSSLSISLFFIPSCVFFQPQQFGRTCLV